MIRNTLHAWGTPARWLHWIVAALVLSRSRWVGGGSLEECPR